MSLKARAIFQTTLSQLQTGGISGVIKGDNKDARNDFALRMLCFVEAGNSTGYLCAVKRERDGLIKYVSCTPF